MKRLKRRFRIPIYGVDVWIVVSDDIGKVRRSMDHIFGPCDTGGFFAGLCSCSDSGDFALFFRPNRLTYSDIGHEVFHLTHRIMEYYEGNFDSNHHEQGAYLHGYLMDLVCNLVLGKGKK